ncbi:hypothetical protein FHG87_008265 [Trinorchestia longiramus]|nr:hypothetical protein FHG87_024496 [Trinorchestia longiramus]KAF2360986.1 hypothetical protein FHG87_008265 [Trinorchestia longiramus]
MSDSIYFVASKEPLKLKGVKDSGIKKKKKKKSKKIKEEATSDSSKEQQHEIVTSPGASKGYSAQRTKAEMHFLQRQRQMEEDRIKKKASKSHKEKVEEFNRNLDSQSEHFDIPKVSWTK